MAGKVFGCAAVGCSGSSSDVPLLTVSELSTLPLILGSLKCLPHFFNYVRKCRVIYLTITNLLRSKKLTCSFHLPATPAHKNAKCKKYKEPTFFNLEVGHLERIYLRRPRNRAKRGRHGRELVSGGRR